MRMLCRLSAGLFVATGLAACQFPVPPDVPDDDDPTMRSIGGAVTGLWTGGAITVRLVSGGVTEDVAATAAEPFVFAHKLADGASYLVTVVDDGPDHDCTIGNGSGQVAGDVTDLAVACTNLVPHGLSISTPIAFTFDPRTTRYMLPVSVLQQEVAVTVTGTSLTAVTVAGQPATVGVPSPRVPLGQGQTTVVVELTKGSLSRRYELVFDRGARAIEEASLVRAANGEAGDYFGKSAAADGDWIAIGAAAEDSADEIGSDNSVPDAGAVYMFQRNGVTWTQRQMLKGSVVTRDRGFGDAVAMRGDTLVIGAPGDDGVASNAGSLYFFGLDPATGRWHETQRIPAPQPTAQGRFGQTVSIDGGYVAVSAPGYGIYVYKRIGATWSLDSTLARPAGVASMGYLMAFDGDTIAFDGDSAPRVFRRSGQTWNEEVLPTTPREKGVALQGDELVVPPALCRRTGNVWSLQGDVQPPEPITNPFYKRSVQLRDNVMTMMVFDQLMVLQRIGGTWVSAPLIRPTSSAASNGLGDFGALGGDVAVVTAWADNGPNGTSGFQGAAWFFR